MSASGVISMTVSYRESPSSGPKILPQTNSQCASEIGGRSVIKVSGKAPPARCSIRSQALLSRSRVARVVTTAIKTSIVNNSCPLKPLDRGMFAMTSSTISCR